MNNQYITSGISTGYLFFIQMLMLVFRQDLGVFLEHLGVFAGCFCRCRRQTAAICPNRWISRTAAQAA